jgi:RNA polymerase sigma-70 factor (ECF subfamily)
MVEPKSQLGGESSDIARPELEGCTDEDLLIQIHQGHRDSVERLYRRHGPSILALLIRIFDDRQMAEEAVQDTFLAVWNGARFDGRSRVRTWLVAIAIRQAGSKRRRRRLAVGSQPRDFASNDPSPEDAVVAGLDVDRLVKDLSELTRYQREVVLLAFAEQLTHPEIAEVLGVRIGTVKSRLHGAKKALMRKWEQEDRT